MIGRMEVSEAVSYQILAQRFDGGEWVDDGATSPDEHGQFVYTPNTVSEGANLFRFIARPAYYEAAYDGLFDWDSAQPVGFLLTTLPDSPGISTSATYATTGQVYDPTVRGSVIGLELLADPKVEFYLFEGSSELYIGSCECDADGSYEFRPGIPMDGSPVKIRAKVTGTEYATGDLVESSTTDTSENFIQFGTHSDSAEFSAAPSLTDDGTSYILSGAASAYEVAGSYTITPQYVEIDYDGDANGLPDDYVPVDVVRRYVSDTSFSDEYQFTYSLPDDFASTVSVRTIGRYDNNDGTVSYLVYGTWAPVSNLPDDDPSPLSSSSIVELAVTNMDADRFDLIAQETPAASTSGFFVSGKTDQDAVGTHVVEFDWALGLDSSVLDGEADQTVECDIDGSFFAEMGFAEAGTYQVRMRTIATDEITGEEVIGSWDTTFSIEITDSTGATVDGLALAFPDADDPLSTAVPTIVGSVVGLDDPSYATVEINLNPGEDGDDTPDLVILADADGGFEYTIDQSDTGSVVLAFRVVSQNLLGTVNGEWQSFSFEYRDYEAPSLDAGSLVFANMGDDLTTFPTLAGQANTDDGTTGGYLELDFDGDGEADDTAYLEDDGRFELVLDLAPGSYTVSSRGICYADGTKYEAAGFTNSGFTFEIVDPSAIQVLSLAPDTEDPSRLTAFATIDGVGTQLYLDVDTNADGEFDLEVETDENGVITFKPLGLVTSTAATVVARARFGESDNALCGVPTQFQFDYAPGTIPSPPTVASFGVLHDTGTDTGNDVTTDPTLRIELSRSESVEGLQVEFLYRADGEDEWICGGTGNVDESGLLDYVLLSDVDSATPLGYGTYDVTALVKEWNPDTGLFGIVTFSQTRYTFVADDPLSNTDNVAPTLRDDDPGTDVNESLHVETGTVDWSYGGETFNFDTSIWVGHVDNPDGPLEGLLVEVDYDNDGIADDFTYSFVDDTGASPAGMFHFVPADFATNNGTSSFDVRVRVGEPNHDPLSDSEYSFGAWSAAQTLSYAQGTYETPGVVELGLRSRTSESVDPVTSADPTIAGRVSDPYGKMVPRTVSLQVYEIVDSGDDILLSTDTLTTRANGRFVFLPSGLTLGESYEIRAAVVMTDVLDDEGLSLGEQSFSFTYSGTNAPPEFALIEGTTDPDLGLKNDTGTAGDMTTSDPTIVGKIDNDGNPAGIVVEFEVPDAGAPGGYRVIGKTTTNADGAFSFTPDGLAYNDPTTIYVTPREYDPVSEQYLEPQSAQTVTFTLVPYATVEIDNMAFTSTPSDFTDVTDLEISGEIDTADASPTDEVRLSHVLVEFDHDNDGNADGSTLTEADGTFTYTPAGLVPGIAVTLRARVRQWNYSEGAYSDSDWALETDAGYLAFTPGLVIPTPGDEEELEAVKAAGEYADQAAHEAISAKWAGGRVDVGAGTFSSGFQPTLKTDEVGEDFVADSPFEPSDGQSTNVTLNTDIDYFVTYVSTNDFPGGSETHTVTVTITSSSYIVTYDPTADIEYTEHIEYSAEVLHSVVYVYTFQGLTIHETRNYTSVVECESEYTEDITFDDDGGRTAHYTFEKTEGSSQTQSISGSEGYTSPDANSHCDYSGSASAEWGESIHVSGDYVLDAALPGDLDTTVYDYACSASGRYDYSGSADFSRTGTGHFDRAVGAYSENGTGTSSENLDFSVALTENITSFVVKATLDEYGVPCDAHSSIAGNFVYEEDFNSDVSDQADASFHFCADGGKAKGDGDYDYTTSADVASWFWMFGDFRASSDFDGQDTTHSSLSSFTLQTSNSGGFDASGSESVSHRVETDNGTSEGDSSGSYSMDASYDSETRGNGADVDGLFTYSGIGVDRSGANISVTDSASGSYTYQDATSTASGSFSSGGAYSAHTDSESVYSTNAQDSTIVVTGTYKNKGDSQAGHHADSQNASAYSDDDESRSGGGAASSVSSYSGNEHDSGTFTSSGGGISMNGTLTETTEYDSSSQATGWGDSSRYSEDAVSHSEFSNASAQESTSNSSLNIGYSVSDAVVTITSGMTDESAASQGSSRYSYSGNTANSDGSASVWSGAQDSSYEYSMSDGGDYRYSETTGSDFSGTYSRHEASIGHTESRSESYGNTSSSSRSCYDASYVFDLSAPYDVDDGVLSVTDGRQEEYGDSTAHIVSCSTRMTADTVSTEGPPRQTNKHMDVTTDQQDFFRIADAAYSGTFTIDGNERHEEGTRIRNEAGRQITDYWHDTFNSRVTLATDGSVTQENTNESNHSSHGDRQWNTRLVERITDGLFATLARDEHSIETVTSDNAVDRFNRSSPNAWTHSGSESWATITERRVKSGGGDGTVGSESGEVRVRTTEYVVGSQFNDSYSSTTSGEAPNAIKTTNSHESTGESDSYNTSETEGTYEIVGGFWTQDLTITENKYSTRWTDGSGTMILKAADPNEANALPSSETRTAHTSDRTDRSNGTSYLVGRQRITGPGSKMTYIESQSERTSSGRTPIAGTDDAKTRSSETTGEYSSLEASSVSFDEDGNKHTFVGAWIESRSETTTESRQPTYVSAPNVPGFSGPTGVSVLSGVLTTSSEVVSSAQRGGYLLDGAGRAGKSHSTEVTTRKSATSESVTDAFGVHWHITDVTDSHAIVTHDSSWPIRDCPGAGLVSSKDYTHEVTTREHDWWSLDLDLEGDSRSFSLSSDGTFQTSTHTRTKVQGVSEKKDGYHESWSDTAGAKHAEVWATTEFYSGELGYIAFGWGESSGQPWLPPVDFTPGHVVVTTTVSSKSKPKTTVTIVATSSGSSYSWSDLGHDDETYRYRTTISIPDSAPEGKALKETTGQYKFREYTNYPDPDTLIEYNYFPVDPDEARAWIPLQSPAPESNRESTEDGEKKPWYADDWTDWINPFAYAASASNAIGRAIGAFNNFDKDIAIQRKMRDIQTRQIARGGGDIDAYMATYRLPESAAVMIETLVNGYLEFGTSVFGMASPAQSFQALARASTIGQASDIAINQTIKAMDGQIDNCITRAEKAMGRTACFLAGTPVLVGASLEEVETPPEDRGQVAAAGLAADSRNGWWSTVAAVGFGVAAVAELQRDRRRGEEEDAATEEDDPETDGPRPLGLPQKPLDTPGEVTRMRETESPEPMPPAISKSDSAAPSRRRAPVVFGCILLSLFCGWSALGGFFSSGNRPEPRKTAYPVAAEAAAHRSPSSDTTTTRDIETIRVGQRVLTGKEGEESSPTAVNPATWRLLTLHSKNRWADGTIDDVHVQTLQPPEWIAEHGARPGATVPIPLDLVEMGLPEDMTAEVVANEPCPEIESGPGRVVLTTVNHLNKDVHTLTVADTSGKVDDLGVTGFHKFYSLDRSAWVSCKDLHDNEQIRGFPDRRLTVLTRSHLRGTYRVYNMTVETEHVYHVGALGVLTHNNGCARRVGDVAGGMRRKGECVATAGAKLLGPTDGSFPTRIE